MLSAADRTLVDRGQLAIEEGNLKPLQQALTAVEKRLKKSDSDHLKALQCLLKCHLGQISENATVLLQLEERVAEKHLIADINAIRAYDDALELILPKSGATWARTIGHLRSELVKAAPKDEEASRACFRACLAKEDYENARKIANSLEKNFSGKHEYVFWNIVAMFLYSRQSRYPERERKLYGALAEGLICKLAETTVKAADTIPLPVRCIRTPQELLLLDDILKTKADKNMDEARLEFLQSPFLGPESKIAKGEWQLWRLKLELLKKTGSSDRFNIAADLLKRARTNDEPGVISDSRFSDWLVWQLYLEAASSKLDVYKEKVEAEVKAHLDPDSGVDKSWRRNAELALLKFGADKRFLVMSYLQRCGDTNTAYVDLRPTVQDMVVRDTHVLLSTLLANDTEETPRQEDEVDSRSANSLYPLNQDFSTARGIVRLVNIYKLIFLISSSMPEDRRRQSPEKAYTCERCSMLLTDVYCRSCLTQLALATMKSYGLAMKDDGEIKQTLERTDRHPADDLCILSATCLVKLSSSEYSLSSHEPFEAHAFSRLLQAAVLLEFAWSHSKPNSQILLMLTRLYTILGCGSLAFRAYKNLSTKQIQHASLSYYFFDGLSSVHPHPFPTEDSPQQKTIIDDLREQQKIYRNAIKSIRIKCWSAIEHNNYNTVLELEDFKKCMSFNMSVVMSVVESRKVSRLTQPTIQLTATSCGYDILPFEVEDPSNIFTDTNDYDAPPNFEKLGIDSPLSQPQCQVRVPFSDSRVHTDLFIEQVQTMLDPKTDSVSITSTRVWLRENLGSIRARLATQTIDEDHVLEDFRNRIFYGIGAFVTEEFQGNEFPDCQLIMLKDHLQQLVHVFDGYKVFAPARQDILFAFYTLYELGASILRFHAYLDRNVILPAQFSELVRQIKSYAEHVVGAVIDKSSTIKRSLDESGWMTKVLEKVSNSDPDAEDKTSVSETLQDVIGEAFMEQWAAEVVESWKDSVKGFAFFKPTGNAA